jgi:hypothetical protein
MKNELIDFVNNELGYFMDVKVSKAIKKYFKGKEVEWQEKVKQMYIPETHCLSQSNGELYIDGEFGSLVWNCETLFTDLPHIVRMVYEARTETDKRVKEQIEEITRLVTQ